MALAHMHPQSKQLQTFIQVRVCCPDIQRWTCGCAARAISDRTSRGSRVHRTYHRKEIPIGV